MIEGSEDSIAVVAGEGAGVGAGLGGVGALGAEAVKVPLLAEEASPAAGVWKKGFALELWTCVKKAQKVCSIDLLFNFSLDFT